MGGNFDHPESAQKPTLVAVGGDPLVCEHMVGHTLPGLLSTYDLFATPTTAALKQALALVDIRTLDHFVVAAGYRVRLLRGARLL